MCFDLQRLSSEEGSDESTGDAFDFFKDGA